MDSVDGESKKYSIGLELVFLDDSVEQQLLELLQ